MIIKRIEPIDRQGNENCTKVVKRPTAPVSDQGKNFIKHRFKKFLTSSLIICALWLLAACQSENEHADVDEIVEMDFELEARKIHIWWNGSFNAPYRDYISGYLNDAFGRDKFEYQEYIGGLLSDEFGLGGLLRRQATPDLIVFDSMLLSFFIESNYLEPMDLEAFLPLKKEVLDELRALSPDRQLYALPYGENVPALFYNKTLFDLMKVPYPTDDMTWDEVIKLAEQVKNPTAWISLSVDDYDQVASQLSLKLFNKETERVVFETDAWSELEQFIDRHQALRKGEIYSGSMDFGGSSSFSEGMTSFTGDKVAMIAGSMFGNSNFIGRVKQLDLFDVDWDIASYPVFDSSDPLAPGRHMILIGVPRMSQNKEDAYKIIKYLLSEPVQFENMRRGLLSLREDADARLDEFGSALWSGKSGSFLDPSIPKGKYDPDLDDQKFVSSMGLNYNPNDLTDWELLWSKDSIQDRIMEYRQKRTNVLLELREKTDAYEQYNR